MRTSTEEGYVAHKILRFPLAYFRAMVSLMITFYEKIITRFSKLAKGNQNTETNAFEDSNKLSSLQLDGAVTCNIVCTQTAPHPEPGGHGLPRPAAHGWTEF